MQYHSTRNSSLLYPAEEILLAPAAQDGGCFVPQSMPRPMKDGDLASLAWLSHARRLTHLMGKFSCGPQFDELVGLTQSVFTKEAYGINTVPVAVREGLYYLGLCHGPTNSPDDFILPVLSGLGGGGESCWAAFLCRAAVWVSGYCEMVLRRHISFGSKIDVCAGSRRDYLAAALFARSLGLPVGKIIYTSEISAREISPGLERAFYMLSGGDCAIVAEAARTSKIPAGLITAIENSIVQVSSVPEASDISGDGGKLLIIE
ncbi:MAG: hypothetical protein FWH02_01370 [Oscillospiraceae bacterium]|nr:hypothetical protein [Oscillospiraceae bacterium]